MSAADCIFPACQHNGCACLPSDRKGPRITGAPGEIWLCYGDIEHDDTHADCCAGGEVTWCESKQGPGDVRYMRADLAAVPVSCQTYGPGVTVPCGECNQTLVDSHELAELRTQTTDIRQALADSAAAMGMDYCDMVAPVDLPPLPEPGVWSESAQSRAHYTATQMRAYARAAMAQPGAEHD